MIRVDISCVKTPHNHTIEIFKFNLGLAYANTYKHNRIFFSNGEPPNTGKPISFRVNWAPITNRLYSDPVPRERHTNE